MVLSETPKSPNSYFMARKGMPSVFQQSPARTFSSTAPSPLRYSVPPSPAPSTSTSTSPSPSPIHKFSKTMMEENIQTAELIITKWDTNSSSINRVTSLFQNRKEAKEFPKSVQDLRSAMHFFASEHSTSDRLALAQKLMKMAMMRLEKEFYQILSSTRQQLDPESVSGRSSDGSSNFEDEIEEIGSEDEFKTAGESSTNVERATAVVMADLKAIAYCMISSGYGKECFKIYVLIRKSIVDEGLYLLGIEILKPSQVQKMNWEALEHLIKNWLHAVKVAVKTLFGVEKILCDHVFSASDSLRESCFSEMTKEGAINLFKFPELVTKTKTKKLPERIFPLMELYEAVTELWPEIELIFNSESTAAIKLQALSSLQTLGESVSSILSGFESTLQKDSSKTIVAGGGIHPLTQSAMSYISSLADYSGVLSDIVTDSPPPQNTELPESYFESPTSTDGWTPAVSVRLARLILVLLCKLDAKAGLYKDVSLSYLFLVNNVHFIIEKVCTTCLKGVLGEDWVFKHVKKVKQYASSYETMAWIKVFLSLPSIDSPELSPEAAKGCFRRFNAAFEEAYRRETSRIVPNRKLRDELKVSIAKKLVPAYKEFYDRYMVMLSGERNLDVFVMFSPDDLGNYLSYLFYWVSSISDSPSASPSRGCLPR